MNLIYSTFSLLTKILIEECEKKTMPPDLAVSKNNVMPILFQVEGPTKMVRHLIVLHSWASVQVVQSQFDYG